MTTFICSLLAAACGTCAEMPHEVTVTAGVPSDADVLYDGTSLDKWRNINGGPAGWHIQPDKTLLVDKTGNTPGAVLASIYTRDVYTNFQMHVEYRIPEDIDYSYQWRGNSGVKVFGCYEVQIIDSFRNPMKPVQMCGAIYSNCPPLANASQKPGDWQSFDIVFHAPVVDGETVKERARITVFHNGVLVQDNSTPPPYPDKPENRVKTSGSIELQSHNDHSKCISFRNVWIRRLPAAVSAGEASAACFSLDVADDFVRDARRTYALPEYAAYTNSLIGTGRYGGLRLVQACAERRPWREGSVRWISAPKANNIRDIGGWNGLKTGLVYRGSEFDSTRLRGVVDERNPDKKPYANRDLTEEGRRVFREEMRIRTDLDLRNPKYHTVLGEDIRHVVEPVGSYHRMIDTPKGRQHVAECLRVFANETNYPVYVHCAGGADRTGSIVFLLEGLCGVSETDLSIDYELTSFGGIGYRRRVNHSYHFGMLVARMKECPGDSLPEQIAWYVKNELGLTQEEITSIRRILVAPSDCSSDIVLESGGKRLRLGLDGRLKPSGVPFLTLVTKDGRTFPCTRVADDALGDLYFGFSEKRLSVVVGAELRPDGLAFPVRSAVKDAEVVLAEEARAVMGRDTALSQEGKEES